MIRIFIFFLSLLLFQGTDIHKADSDIETQDPIISFGLVSDVQYCDCESTEIRFFRGAPDKLRAAIGDFNNQPLDFVISLGDLIDRDFNSFSEVLTILDSSNADVYHVLGNHDFDMDPKLRRNVFSELETGPGYYSFEKENFRFIVVNSNDISTYAVNNKKRKEALSLIEQITAENGINGFEWNGGLGARQLKWLEKELESASENKQKVLVFSHHPLWPDSRHNILNYKEITSLIDNYNNIVGWFCGHNHNGGYGNYNLVHCVNFKGMVDTPDSNAYSVVELYHNKIWIKGRGREKSQILAY